MDFDILDSLDDLGYPGLIDDIDIKEAIKVGPKSVLFTQLVEWFSKELQALCGLDSCVNAITDPDDSSSFLMEVSSFLKEMRCPYKDLVSGSISQRLIDVNSKVVLLDYLCTELQAARLHRCKSKQKNSMEIEVEDSCTALDLNLALKTLNIQVDVSDDPSSLFLEIEKQINNHISSNSETITEAAVEENLSEQQWDSVESLYKDFLHEYGVRRDLLLTRLDVTIQSFKWGEGSKGKENAILKAYVHKRGKLKKSPSVKLSDVIAARQNILEVEKTSSDNLVKNTKSSINRILIPAVPDRGGRPKEQRPPMEMPNWSKRSQGGRGDYRGGGGHHRGGGYQKKMKGGKRN